MGMGITTKRRSSVTGTSGGGLPGAKAGRAQTGGLPVPVSGGSGQGGSTSLADLKARMEQDKERAAAEAAAAEEADSSSKLTRKEVRTLRKQERSLAGEFTSYPHLMRLKPKEKYSFHSDYFRIDGTYATIMSFFHDDAAQDNFVAFWGIDMITSDMPEGVTTVLLEQVRRRGEKWVAEHTKTSEKLDKLAENEEASGGGTSSSRRKSAKRSHDLDVTVGEIQDGASYLHVHMRLLVKAPSLKRLDDAVERIERMYIERFATLRAAPYHGEQRQELSKLFAPNNDKRGKGFGFTSVEYAGSHSLVTNGLNDAGGEYVGHMIGDVNTSAVLLDVNGYDHHVVVAGEDVNKYLGRNYVSNSWGSKISQAALVENGKVVHLVLDNTNLDQMGPRLDAITARLDMHSGDINMFEMFGEHEDELAIFPTHLEKLVLMTEQIHESNEADRSIIQGALKDTLIEFYVDKNMWARNAKANRDKLRLVGIPHDQVPRLQDLVTYFDTRYKALVNAQAKDQDQVRSYAVLGSVFRSMLDANGSLFNTHTNDSIDGVAQARRVVYDFSRLIRRGKGVAMAQLVNTIGFAVDNLGVGDTVVIHGTENIDARVKDYLNTQFEHLYVRGGRVAYLYNSVEKMLKDADFNKFDAADYTILGAMREPVVDQYQKQLHQEIPPDLSRLITRRGEELQYLRRGTTNVVFRMDITLGLSEASKDPYAGRSSPEQRAAAESSVAAAVGAAKALAEGTTKPKAPEPVTEAEVGAPRPMKPVRGSNSTKQRRTGARMTANAAARHGKDDRG